MQRSVAASIAAILEIDAGEVPVPDERHPEPWTVWNQWLALRGLGLVAIDTPARFNWPGPWLAVLRAADGDGRIGVVAFGAPPGVADYGHHRPTQTRRSSRHQHSSRRCHKNSSAVVARPFAAPMRAVVDRPSR